MATTWRLAKGKSGELCGALLGCRIAEGGLVQVVKLPQVSRTLLRCEAHAIGDDDPEAKIKAILDGQATEEARLERDALADAGLNPEPRRLPHKQPQSWASIGDVFDPKSLAAGNDK